MSEIHICGDPEYRLRLNGKLVRFRFNPWYGGPSVLGRDGKWSSPGKYSRFWPAWKRWLMRNGSKLL